MLPLEKSQLVPLLNIIKYKPRDRLGILRLVRIE